MSILNKITTAIRGMFSEAVVDTQAMRILDQEMRDAKNHLNDAKENLTNVIAEQIGVERNVKQLQKSVNEHEGYVAKLH